MKMKADQERVSKLLTDTVTLLCKNGLIYNQEIKVQGLLGITLDNKDVFIVQINEVIGGTAPASSESGEGGRRKNSSSVNSTVVDLTRVADTPAPLLPQGNIRGMPMMQHGMVPMPNSGARKQRQMHPQQPQQHMMMPPSIQSQQSQMHNNRPTYNPRMRMNSTTLPPGFNNQFAASYMARLQQQVAMVPPPPMRMMSPSMRQRSALRRQPSSVAASQQNLDDEEDVVIIGTGHEEPSPSWNSPSRRQMSSSQALNSSSSELRPRPSSHISTKAQQSKRPKTDSKLSHSPFNRHSKAVQEMEEERMPSDVEVTGTLELTAEDVPQSVEQLVLRATSSMITNEDGDTATVVVQPDHSLMNPEENDDQITLPSDSIIAETAQQVVSRVMNAANDLSASGSHSDGLNTHSSSDAWLGLNVGSNDERDKAEHPLVYTDNAESESDLGGVLPPSTMDIETPGFDVLTSSDETLLKVVPNEQQVWPCRFLNCDVSFAGADQLAAHYQTSHGESSGDKRQATREHGETANDGTAADEESLECPFPDCGTRLTSRAGLQAHKLNVHENSARALQSTEGTLQRKRHAPSNPSDQRAKIPHSKGTRSSSSSDSISGGFLCPIVGCTAQYSSREEMYDHVQVVHRSNAADDNAAGTPAKELVQTDCKQEL